MKRFWILVLAVLLSGCVTMEKRSGRIDYTSIFAKSGLNIDVGDSNDKVDVAYGGTNVGESTGTVKVVLSESPTLTGTVIAANIDGSGTISANLFTPDATDGADIGTDALEFSDIYLADGSII